MLQAANYGVVCDGVKDDTAALQKALDSVKSYQALQLPAGTCNYSKTLNFYGKTNAMVFGAGKDSTILKALDPLNSSFIVTSSKDVIVSGFQVYSPNTTGRGADGNSRGFYVQKSSFVTIDGVKARRVPGAAVLFWVVTDSKILNSVADHNYSDAFHITDAKNILVQYNTSQGSGDDCYASIGYGTGYNYNVNFLDNTCSDNLASGVSFEGSIGGTAYRNKLIRTGVAGIRIASNGSWNTGKVTDIDLRENVLEQVRTRTEVDHAAIMIFTGIEDVSNIKLTNNTIKDPNTYAVLTILNYKPSEHVISNVTFSNNAASSSNGTTKKCYTVSSSGVSGVNLSNNTLNSTACS